MLVAWGWVVAENDALGGVEALRAEFAGQIKAGPGSTRACLLVPALGPVSASGWVGLAAPRICSGALLFR